MRTSRSNLPDQPLRWSVEAASREFGLVPPTLRKSLAKASTRAGADGCYSTKEIVQAVFGDLAGEKLLTQKQLTKKYTLENRITEGAYVDRAALKALFAGVADAMKSRIESSSLTREEKSDLLVELSSVPVGVNGIVKRQSKLRDAHTNGDEDGGE
jgi:hypothetical protein